MIGLSNDRWRWLKITGGATIWFFVNTPDDIVFSLPESIAKSGLGSSLSPELTEPAIKPLGEVKDPPLISLNNISNIPSNDSLHITIAYNK